MMEEVLKTFDQDIVDFFSNAPLVDQVVELGFDEEKGVVDKIGSYRSPISKYRLSLPVDLGKVFIQVKKSWVAHSCLNK